MSRNIRKTVVLSAITAISSFLIPLTTSAHTIWLEPLDGDEYRYELQFGGHGGELEVYSEKQIRSLDAYNDQGVKIDLEKERARHGELNNLVFQLAPSTSLVAIHYDNGIWSKDPMGRSINLPMSQVKGAREATNAIKYHKTIVHWAPTVTRSLGQVFEVIPLSDQQPQAGVPMKVKVLLNGEPLANVKLGHGEAGDAGETDSSGIASFMPQPGFNHLWAGKRFAVDKTDYTELSYEYLLGFDAK